MRDLLPIGITPKHLEVWADCIEKDQKYESNLTDTLRCIAMKIRATKPRVMKLNTKEYCQGELNHFERTLEIERKVDEIIEHLGLDKGDN